MKCCVSKCRSDSENTKKKLQFYKFPINTSKISKWKSILRIDKRMSTKDLFVCELHFSPGWTKKGRRKYLARESYLYPTPIPQGSDNFEDSESEHSTGSAETVSASGSESTASDYECPPSFKQLPKRPRVEIVTASQPSQVTQTPKRNLKITSVKSLSTAATVTAPPTKTKPLRAPRPSVTITTVKQPINVEVPKPVVDDPSAESHVPSTDEELESSRPSRAKMRAMVTAVETINLKRALNSTSHSSDSSPTREFVREKKLHYLRKTVPVLQSQIHIMNIRSRRQTKKITKLSELVSKLSQKQLIDVELEDRLSAVPGAAPNILRRLLCKRKMAYNAEEKKFALTLNFYAPKAYDYVRTVFGFALPNTKIIAKWYKFFKGQPGFCSEAFDAIKSAQENSSNQLFVQVSFDEMPIRQTDWNQARAFGLDAGICKETDQDQVQQILVLLATSVNANWKIALGYFPISGLSAEQKANLIQLCLINVQECHVEVVGVTCYGTRLNYAVLKILGCNFNCLSLQSTFHVGNKALSAFPDPEHAMKLVRNSFAECGFLYNTNAEKIDYGYLKELVKLQEDQQMTKDVQIRKAHAYFANQKMKVKLAVEALSLSVVNALKYCEKLKLPQFQRCRATAEFIEMLNRISKTLEKPLNKGNVDQTLEFAEEAICYMRNLRLANQTKLMDSTHSIGFTGLIVCLNNLPRMYNATVEGDNMTNLQMNKLTQQHIESYFEGFQIQKSYGKNNPTFLQFRSNFKRLLLQCKIEQGVGNCASLSGNLEASLVAPGEEDVDKTLQAEEKKLLEIYRHILHYRSLSIFADDNMNYIAAFIVRQLQQQLKCEKCTTLLEGGWRRGCQIWYNKLGYLRCPSASVFRICKVSERALRAIGNCHDNAEFNRIKRQVRRSCVDCKVFEDSDVAHVNHRLLLIDAVCEKYVFMRFFYINLTKNSQTRRSKYHRVALSMN